MRQLAFLSEIRPVLCSGADGVAMLRRVAQLAARSLTEYCIVDMVERRRVERVSIAHADASLFDRLRSESERFTPRPGGRIERMLVSREPEVVAVVRGARTSMTPRAARGASVSPRALRPDLQDLDFWEAFVPASYMTVPIEVRGELVAVMTFAASRTPLRFDAERLAFACEVGAWCGLALTAARSLDVDAGRAPRFGRESEPPTGIRRRTKEAG